MVASHPSCTRLVERLSAVCRFRLPAAPGRVKAGWTRNSTAPTGIPGPWGSPSNHLALRLNQETGTGFVCLAFVCTPYQLGCRRALQTILIVCNTGDVKSLIGGLPQLSSRGDTAEQQRPEGGEGGQEEEPKRPVSIGNGEPR